jgi:hypothetical protein
MDRFTADTFPGLGNAQRLAEGWSMCQQGCSYVTQRTNNTSMASFSLEPSMKDANDAFEDTKIITVGIISLIVSKTEMKLSFLA